MDRSPRSMQSSAEKPAELSIPGPDAARRLDNSCTKHPASTPKPFQDQPRRPSNQSRPRSRCNTPQRNGLLTGSAPTPAHLPWGMETQRRRPAEHPHRLSPPGSWRSARYGREERAQGGREARSTAGAAWRGQDGHAGNAVPPPCFLPCPEDQARLRASLATANLHLQAIKQFEDLLAKLEIIQQKLPARGPIKAVRPARESPSAPAL